MGSEISKQIQDNTVKRVTIRHSDIPPYCLHWSLFPANDIIVELFICFNSEWCVNWEFLPCYTFVTSILLSGIHLNLNNLRQLATFVNFSCVVTELVIENSIFDSKYFSLLASAIANNTTLTKVVFHNTQMRDEEATHVSSALASNTSITELDLSFNQIGDDGVCELACALSSNTTLVRLTLLRNRVGDRGVCRLSDALLSNATLEHLEISSNQIGDEGAVALAIMARHNTTLSTLILHNNNVRKCGRGYTELTNAFAVNQGLSTLRIVSRTTPDSTDAEEYGKRNTHNRKMKQWSLFDRLLQSKRTRLLFFYSN